MNKSLLLSQATVRSFTGCHPSSAVKEDAAWLNFMPDFGDVGHGPRCSCGNGDRIAAWHPSRTPSVQAAERRWVILQQIYTLSRMKP